MAKCKDCKNSCYLLNEYDEPYFWCNVFEDNFDEEREVLCIGYRPKTNADKIRSMTDEKLAEFIAHDVEWIEICKNCKSSDLCDNEENCVLSILKWLKEEIK